MNEAPNNMTTGRDDEVTFDPEETSAADAQWLAELRANAKSSKQSVRELLDDETIGAGDDTMSEIREAVRATRRGSDAVPAPVGPLDVPESESESESESEPVVRVEHAVDDTPEPLAPPTGPEPARRPERPAQTPLNTRPAPPPPAVTKRPSTPSAPPAPPAQRWEPPPRLAPTIEVEPPVRLADDDPGALTSVRLAAIAAVTLVVIVIVVLFWSRTGDAPAEPPDDSGVVVVDPDVGPVDDQVDPPSEEVDE